MSPPNPRSVAKKPGCIPSRYYIFILMCWCNIAYTALQLNFNVTIVAMVNQTALQSIALTSDECVVKEEPDNEDLVNNKSNSSIDLNNNDTSMMILKPLQSTNLTSGEGVVKIKSDYDYLVIDLNDNDTSIVPLEPSGDVKERFVKMEGELLWSPHTQGFLLGAIFFGYISTHLIGGFLADIFGGKWLLFTGVFIPSVLSFFIPAAARNGVESMFFIRVLQGLAMGLVIPVFYAMTGEWGPVHERSIIMASTYFGSVFGSALIVVLSGLICSSEALGGWPYVFYVSGIFGLCFSLVWALCGFSSPDDHPTISSEEKLFIKNSIEESSALRKRDAKAPWIDVMKSAPFWSLFLVRFTYAWGLYTEQTAVPLYLQTVFNIPVEQNGYVNGAMYTASALSSVIGGFVADQLRQRTSFGINCIRKSFSVMAYVGAAFCWISITFSGCQILVASSFIVLSKFFLALSIAGDWSVVVDMAPQYAGALSGVLFTVADSAGFLSPLVTGSIIDSNVTLSQWSYVFYCVSTFVIIGLLAFVIFGSAELQPWAMDDSTNVSRRTDSQATAAVTPSIFLSESTALLSGSTKSSSGSSRLLTSSRHGKVRKYEAH